MIFINGRFLTQKITGGNRYAIGICEALKELGVTFKIVVPEWYTPVYDFDFIQYGRRKSHSWEQIDLYRCLRANGRPLLINLSGLGPLLYGDQMITILDLSFMRNPAWFSRSYRTVYSLLTPMLAKKAKKVITISEFSKSEIISLLGTPAGKIVVATPGLTPLRKADEAPATPRPGLPTKYVLAVSSIDPRKNFKRLIEAFGLVSHKEYHLLIVGKKAAHFGDADLDANSERVQFLGYVSDAELDTLYKNAGAFIYPSLYEGFGIPPLEAMSSNCPVIAADIPCLRETCGDAALFVDPYSQASIAGGIDLLIDNMSLREELKKKGLQNVGRYSFLASAREIKKALPHA